MAEVQGLTEKAAEVQVELDELEERAQELDRKRTSNVNSIRSAGASLLRSIGR